MTYEIGREVSKRMRMLMREASPASAPALVGNVLVMRTRTEAANVNSENQIERERYQGFDCGVIDTYYIT